MLLKLLQWLQEPVLHRPKKTMYTLYLWAAEKSRNKADFIRHMT
nr:MAG TPA: hypothetical protein [Caudoviricetes sp.]